MTDNGGVQRVGKTASRQHTAIDCNTAHAHSTYGTRLLKLGQIGNFRALLKNLIIHAENRLNNRDKQPMFLDVVDPLRKLVYMSARINRDRSRTTPYHKTCTS